MKDTIVKENGNIVLECKVNKSRVKPVWSKDGKPLIGRFGAEIKHDGQVHRLTISNAQLSDIGKYTVSFDDDDCVQEANVDIKGTISLLFLAQLQICKMYSSRNSL